MSVDRTPPGPDAEAGEAKQSTAASPLSSLKRFPSAAPPAEAGSAAGPPVDVTEAAARKIREFQGEHAEFAGKLFRIKVDGGGCAGFRYTFVFDDPMDGDLKLEFHGVSIVIDPFTMPYLKESTIDYVGDLMSAGFTVTNPNSTSTCGCGHSFGV